MSGKNQGNKRRRYVSEISQTSGASGISNVTETTDLDSDERNSNTSETNQNSELRGLVSDTADGPRFNNLNTTNVPGNNFRRKRQVSWSVCDEEDEEIFIEHPNNENDTRVKHPYDNNFQGVNERYPRTRRATESSLDTRGILPNRGNTTAYPPLPHRNHTTSQLSDYDIQTRLITEQLVREHDERQQMHAIPQQRRSQSVTSLSGRRQPFLADNLHQYTSLIGENKRMNPGCTSVPVETCVSINPNSNYIQPVVDIDRRTVNRSISSNNFPSDSGYEDGSVLNGQQKLSRKTISCFAKCSAKFFKKGFYVLLLLNVILVLLNIVGLPFLYFAMSKQPPESMPSAPSAGQLTGVHWSCITCGSPDTIWHSRLQDVGFNITSNGQCCLQQNADILPALTEMTKYLVRQDVRAICQIVKCDKTEDTTILQLKATGDLDKNVVVWETRHDINTDKIVLNKTKVTVSKAGYYYVYSRVNYVKPASSSQGSPGFAVGHALYKIDRHNEPLRLDGIQEISLPNGSAEDIRHTSHLGSVQHLERNEQLYIQLDNGTFLDKKNTMFGMFLIT